MRERPPVESAYATGRILLDTHAWLWWQSDDHRLGVSARRAITEASDVFFSAASAWEIAIKASLGKLTLPPDDSIEAQLERDGFRAISVSVAHAETVRALPRLHRDPFDRILVAQALCEGLVILTDDLHISRYDVRVLAAVR